MAARNRKFVRNARDPLQRVRATGEALAARAFKARHLAAAAAGRLEGIFEERVQRAVSLIGVPTRRDVIELSEQVARLQHSVDQLRRGRSRA